MYKITIAELKKITKMLDKTGSLFYKPQDLLVHKQVKDIEKVKKEAKALSKQLKNNYYL
jgi:hypothetical protein